MDQWDPAANPYHRMLQALDILVLNLHRFRHHADYHDELDDAQRRADLLRMRREYLTLRAALRDHAELDSPFGIDRLSTQALAFAGRRRWKGDVVLRVNAAIESIRKAMRQTAPVILPSSRGLSRLQSQLEPEQFQ